MSTSKERGKGAEFSVVTQLVQEVGKRLVVSLSGETTEEKENDREIWTHNGLSKK